MTSYRLFFVLVAAIVFHFSFATPLLNGNNPEKEVKSEVQELENLHREIGNPKSAEKRQSKDSEAQPEPEIVTSQPSENDGEQQTNSRSAIFRHRGITEAKRNNAWNTENNENDDYSKFSGVQYTPTDLAAYIFSTGDEEGVAVAVEELVREGMMGRTDAINYLQDVKQALTYMRDQYEHQKTLQEIKNRAYIKQQITQGLLNPPREQLISDINTEKREPQPPETAPATTESPQISTESTSLPKLSTNFASSTSSPEADKEPETAKNDSKRRLPIIPNTMNELSLERIIYRVAKDMFTESIVRGDQTAEDTLGRLMAFLEEEVNNDKISRHMKEKVLEILSSALLDTLKEYQQELIRNEAIYDDFRYVKKTDPMDSSSKMIPEAFQKLAMRGQNTPSQMPSTEQKSS